MLLIFSVFQIDKRRLTCIFACAAIGLAAAGNTCHGDTWAERLGFPADKKVVILHVQEIGVCFETNQAGERLLESGSATSSSAMVPGPWFSRHAAWCRKHMDADAGLSLTLNSNWPEYRWRPLASSDFTASLTDADGFFWSSMIQTMVNAHAEEVEREMRAQIERARTSGVDIGHLTCHLGTAFARLDLTQVYMSIAREYWIPAVVVELTPQHLERFRSQGFPLPDELVQLMDDYPLPKVDDLQFITPAASYEEMKRALLQQLSEFHPGITQLTLHPAVDSEALRQIAPNWQQRVWEAQLMDDADVRAALTAQDVVLTNWRELMARFEGRALPSTTPNPQP